MDSSTLLPDSQHDDLELTPSEALDQLELSWRNELLAPELLPIKADLMDSLLEQIREIEDAVNKTEKTTLDATLKRMEVDRIRYVITSYLRCRLQKIEAYVFHVIADDEKRKGDGDEQKMSPEESRFAKEYETQLEQYFQNVALQRMPSNAQKLDKEKLGKIPDTNHFVFVRIKRNVPDVMIPSFSDQSRDIQVNLERDTQHLLPYKVAGPLLRDGSAFLL